MKRKLASNSGRPGIIGSRTIVLSYPDGTTVSVARSAARRSRVLQQYLNARQGVDDGACSLPRETVLAWLASLEAVAWRQSTVELGGDPTTGTRHRQDQSILEQLKAADFMNDVEAVETASEAAGAWLFPTAHLDYTWPLPNWALPTSEQIEGIRGLSEELIIRVLRDCPASIDCQLSSLPTDFNEAILHAAFPTIDADRALHLSERDFALARHSESLMPVLTFLLRKLNNFSFESIAPTYREQLSAEPQISSPQTVGMLLGCLTGVTRLGLSGNPRLFVRVQHWSVTFRQRLRQGAPDPLERVGLPIPDGAEVLGPRIAALTALRELDLSECRLGPVGATALGPHLECLGAVELLDLKGNELHDAGAVALAPHLAGTASLQRIALSDNKLTSVGVTALKPVFGGAKAMVQIDVSFNDLGPPPLVRQFASGPSDTGDSAAVVAVASAAGAAIASANRLQQLNLSECGLNWQGLSALVGGVASLGAISSLDLSGNRVDSFDSGGAEALGQRLAPMTRLQFLNLTRTRITDSCVQALVPHLARLAALRTLELADNEFGKPGLDVLGDHLTPLKDLQFLDLKGASVRAAEVEELERKLGCSVST